MQDSYNETHNTISAIFQKFLILFKCRVEEKASNYYLEKLSFKKAWIAYSNDLSYNLYNAKILFCDETKDGAKYTYCIPNKETSLTMLLVHA